MQTWNDVFASFGSIAAVARAARVPYQTAAGWKRRNSIPAKRWAALEQGAEQAGVQGVTLAALSRVVAADSP